MYNREIYTVFENHVDDDENETNVIFRETEL